MAEPLGRSGEAGAAQGATMRDQLDLWIQLAAAVICVHLLCTYGHAELSLCFKCPRGERAKREEGTFVWVFFESLYHDGRGTFYIILQLANKLGTFITFP